jgi:iron(III) transport system ATP-binding protein
LHELIHQSSLEQTSSSVLVRPQDIHFSNAQDATFVANVHRCIFRGERYDIELALKDGQRLLAYSDVPMPLESQHYVRLDQAWSLEREL